MPVWVGLFSGVIVYLYNLYIYLIHIRKHVQKRKWSSWSLTWKVLCSVYRFSPVFITDVYACTLGFENKGGAYQNYTVALLYWKCALELVRMSQSIVHHTISNWPNWLRRVIILGCVYPSRLANQKLDLMHDESDIGLLLIKYILPSTDTSENKSYTYQSLCWTVFDCVYIYIYCISIDLSVHMDAAGTISVWDLHWDCLHSKPILSNLFQQCKWQICKQTIHHWLT